MQNISVHRLSISFIRITIAPRVESTSSEPAVRRVGRGNRFSPGVTKTFTFPLLLSRPSILLPMGRKAKTAATPDTPSAAAAATVTRRSTRRGRNRSDSESEEAHAPPPTVNYCEDSPDSDDYSPSKKSPSKRGARGRGRGSSRSAAASSGSDREAARTPKPRGGGRGRRGGVSALSASPVAKDLSVVLESVADTENGGEGEWRIY